MKKLLALNRGEIAIRIFRAANELGLRTVAVYSKEDRLSLHRFKADEAYQIGENKGPVEAYLDVDGIVALAKSVDVDAIHPGYGFLSENPALPRACVKAGLIFVGPTAEMLDALGDTMTSFGATYLRVEGNTDSTGPAAANLTLSEKRAAAVKKYILQNFPNIEASRFQTIGRGSSQPVASNDTETGRQLNRRTEIKVVLAQ